MPKKLRPYFSLESKLINVPRDWLYFIEPKIIRPSDSTCWLWQGGIDGYGEPVLAYTDPVTKKRTAVRLKVFVMKMFWDGIKGHEIIHECGTLNCINMHHLLVGASWRVKDRDRDRLIAKKKENIRQYVKYEKNAPRGL